MIRTIFWNVLEVSAACTAVIFLIMLCSRLIGAVYGAKGRYLLWLVVILRLALPWNAALSQAPVSVDRLAGTLGAAVYTAGMERRNDGLDSRMNGEVNVQTTGLEAHGGRDRAEYRVLTEAGARLWRYQISGILSVVWAAGAVFYILWNLVSYMIFRQKLRRWEEPAADNGMITCYQSVCRELGLKKPPQLKYCPGLPAPFCIGVIHPAIYVSSLSLDEKDYYYVFKHELIHYKRRDLVYKFLLMAARSIHFFNPAVHWMAVCAERDMELSCDSLVVMSCPETARRDYSRAILRCITESRGVKTRLSSHFSGEKEILKRRFNNIMDEKTKRSGRLLAVLTAAVVILLGTLVACGRENGTRAEGPSAGNATERTSLSEAALSEETMDSLWKWKTPYIGNNSAVGNMLLRVSPYLDYKGFELFTDKEPYGVKVNLEVNDWEQYAGQGEISLKPFYKQAAILFCLVDNAGYLEVNLSAGEETPEFTFCAFKISREESMEEYISKEELAQAGESLQNFKEFVNGLDDVLPDTSIEVSRKPQS